MSAVLARDYDDLYLDSLVTKLTAWRAAQLTAGAAASPAIAASALTFNIARDQAAPWNTATPLVNLIETADDYEPSGSSIGRLRIGRATIKAQCFAPLSASRLYYLKSQALAGLFSLDDPQIRTALGGDYVTLSDWPSWSAIPLPEDLELEVDLFCGEWTWHILTAWEPDESTDPSALSSVYIRADEWSALYTAL